jgi:putative ABC transport system permease protein
MNVIESLRQALSALAGNKLRAFLTMLGIIIGVSAMIVMVAVVNGFQILMQRQFEGLGSRLILVLYQPRASQPEARRRFEGLELADVRAIRTQCDRVLSVSAENNLGDVQAVYGGEQHTTRAVGVEPQYQELRGTWPARGRFIEAGDMEARSPVCVLGAEIAAKLFDARDPIGRDITLRGARLTVVGLLEKKGRTLGEDYDDRIYLPLSTVQKRMIGSDRVSALFAESRDPEATEATMDQIWMVLMRRHENCPDFTVDSQSRILASLRTLMVGLGVVLAGVASLSLLVGGIGIMNIMLVTVTERTREIGIRMAVGAKRREILAQFLIEAMTLSGIGGLVGLDFGCSVSEAVAIVAGDRLPAAVPPWAAALALAFALAIGIAAGVYPALRAARLDPIQALRYE